MKDLLLSNSHQKKQTRQSHPPNTCKPLTFCSLWRTGGGDDKSWYETFFKWCEFASTPNEFVGYAADGTGVYIATTKVGSDLGYRIAYTKVLVNGIEMLKPIGYLSIGIGTIADVSKSLHKKQSWGETGVNTAVTGTCLWLGGWNGVLLQLSYSVSKSYLQLLKEHPEYAPSPYGRGRQY